MADLSALPRADLEQLCAARAQKLQLAVGKLRTVHTELKRVQRDYEQLQSIVRSDAGQGAAEQPKEAASDNVEVCEDPIPVWTTLRYTADQVDADTRMSDGSVQAPYGYQ